MVLYLAVPKKSTKNKKGKQMKKMFLALLTGAAALCGAAEYRIEANDMTQAENSEWRDHCAGTNGHMLYATKKDSVLTGTYQIPEAGSYAVWVHTQTNNEGWRKVQLKINDASFGKFGDEKIKDFKKPCLIWKKAMLPLKAEANQIIKVKIIAGANARIDCIVLSSNPDFNPSAMDEASVVDATEALESAE